MKRLDGRAHNWGTKVCKICSISFISSGGNCPYCTTCSKTRRIRLYYSSFPSRITQLLGNAKTRSDANNWEYDLDKDFILDLYEKQEGLCAIIKEPLTIGDSKINTRTMSTDISIDRIDNTKGYTKDNIQLVQQRINFMRCKFDLLDFINICTRISEANL